MALQLSATVSLSSDCKTITFTDTTGDYSSTNTDGWSWGFAVEDSDTTDDWFEIAYDEDFNFQPGDTFVVENSTSNDGTYTIDQLTITDQSIVIYVDEQVPSNNGNGYIASGSTAQINREVNTATLLLQNVCTGVSYSTIDVKSDIQADSSRDKAITSSDLGLSAGVVIPDGLYNVTYTVTGSGNELGNIYTYTTTCLFICNACCDLKDIAYKVASSTCDTCPENKAYMEQANRIFMYFNALKYARACSNTERICKLLTKLNNELTNIDCKTC